MQRITQMDKDIFRENLLATIRELTEEKNLNYNSMGLLF